MNTEYNREKLEQRFKAETFLTSVENDKCYKKQRSGTYQVKIILLVGFT